MATVTIDIPGIGTVEAENAASESTLRELVNLMKKGQGSGSGGTGGGSSGGSSGGSGGGSGGNDDKEQAKLRAKKDAFLDTTGRLTAGLASLGNASIDLVGKFANAGDSLESAAGVFSGIPIVGSMFGLVASSASKVADSFAAGAASGATFDGSIRTMSESASQAGMTLDQFGGFIASNGAAMVALGGETSAGAKRFSTLSRQIRDSGQDLFSLGYSTQTINEGFANYAKQLRMQGLSQRKTDQELVQGSQEYLKEMDQLAKITGEERKVKEAERERLLKDAQFQASMAGLNEDVRKGFLNVVQQMPNDAMADFAKDIMATGTATTKENQLLMSQMPKSAAMLQEMNRKMQRGEAVTAAERDRLNDLMAQEGPKALEQIKFAGAASQELGGVVNALASTQNLQIGGVQASIDAQKKSMDSQEALNERVNEARASIAGMSNEFLMAVSESGALPQLMDAFYMASNLVMEYILPAFQFLGDHMDTVLGLFITYKTAMIALNVITGTLALMKTMEATSVGGLLIAMAPFAAIAIAVVAAIGAVVYGFKKLYDNGWTLGSAFEAMGDNLKSIAYKWLDLYLMVYEKIFGFFGKGEKFKQAREAIKEKQEELKLREEARDARRNEIKAQRGRDEDGNKIDKKTKIERKKELKSLETANKKLDKERQKNVDYNTTDTVSLLKQEAIDQKSGFAQIYNPQAIAEDQKSGSAQISNPVASADLSKTVNSLAGAEEIKGQVVSEKEKEKEETKRKNTAKKGGKKTEEAPPTEMTKKADTSSGGDQNSPRELLAALNTKMDALIRVAGAQLQVQRGMSNDLYNA